MKSASTNSTLPHFVDVLQTKKLSILATFPENTLECHTFLWASL